MYAEGVSGGVVSQVPPAPCIMGKSVLTLLLASTLRHFSYYTILLRRRLESAFLIIKYFEAVEISRYLSEDISWSRLATVM